MPGGGRVWLRVGGLSLWPLVHDRDQLLIERCEEAALRRGDIAVVTWPDQPMVAHLVERLAPVVTASIVGVVDAPEAEVLGRVVAIRRGERRFDLPPLAAAVLRWLPTSVRLIRRVPFARTLVTAIRRAKRE